MFGDAKGRARACSVAAIVEVDSRQDRSVGIAEVDSDTCCCAEVGGVDIAGVVEVLTVLVVSHRVLVPGTVESSAEVRMVWVRMWVLRAIGMACLLRWLGVVAVVWIYETGIWIWGCGKKRAKGIWFLVRERAIDGCLRVFVTFETSWSLHWFDGCEFALGRWRDNGILHGSAFTMSTLVTINFMSFSPGQSVKTAASKESYRRQGMSHCIGEKSNYRYYVFIVINALPELRANYTVQLLHSDI
jgi:hypothetical protein